MLDNENKPPDQSILDRAKLLPETLRQEIHRRGVTGTIGWLFSRVWLRSFVRKRVRLPLTPDSRPIVAVIPCAGKDGGTLSICIESIHRFVQHPVKKILVVTNDVEAIRCQIADCDSLEVIEENRWLAHLNLDPKIPKDLLQQILKFEARRYVGCKHYLVVDADTFFLKPITLFSNNKYRVPYTDSYDRVYHKTLDPFLGSVNRAPVSFICHRMLFNTSLLNQFIESWEKRLGQSWYQTASAISLSHDGHYVPFSEYELYANELRRKHPDRVLLEHWNGADLIKEPAPQSLLEAMERFPDRATASYHWHSDATTVKGT